ncbi:D-alanyl-D-alanine carboxypeptidase, partial [mine drainage metagenome]
MKKLLCWTLAAFALTRAPIVLAGFPIPPAPAFQAKSWVLLDSRTGQVLAESHEDRHLAPASLTKLMVAYITFTALH